MFSLREFAIAFIPMIATMNANAQIEPDMVSLPAACVEVGAMVIDWQAAPLREECLDSFSIGRYEVTFAEYDLFTAATGRAARNDVDFGRENRPVIDVSWFDAFHYAQWLSEQTGKTYRLPTDAEWDYAAMANTELGFKYHWGAEPIENKANCSNCGSQWDGQMSAPAGSFDPNSLGLYDMHGNVWEWTADCYYADDPKDVEDTHCKVGVVRGGSWDVDVSDLVYWVRAEQISTKTARDTGFRLVLEH